MLKTDDSLFKEKWDQVYN
jgi:hypothetical protein